MSLHATHRHACHRRAAALTVVLATAAAAIACGPTLRAFPNADPMASDPDRQPFGPKPDEYFSGLIWDGADQSVFRPMSWFFAVDPGGEAVNVNSMDEVGDSAWFTNRIGPRGLPMEEILAGPCAEGHVLDPEAGGPWIVKGAKPNGENPGFLMKAPGGQRYLLKFDGVKQQPRATAADVIVTRMYHAAGYDTPCNRIVYFDRAILEIDPDATTEDSSGEKIPMQASDLDKIFSKAKRMPDGRWRANASRFLPGRPLGPWRYEGTRDDDANDVVPHEDRRDIRGASVLASWVNHFDSREQNTLDMWRQTDGERGYIQHHFIDFGDCFGSLWEWDALSRRWGHSYLLDGEHIAVDFLTLGALERPWDVAKYGPAGEVFGYFDAEPFDPGDWRNEYPNPAFSRMSDRDAAWMARIIARFTDAHIDALIEVGKFDDDAVAAELGRILKARRDKLLRYWFAELSPLAHPVVVTMDRGPALCLEDLAVTSNVAPLDGREYSARAWLGLELARRDVVGVASQPGQACVRLPKTANASEAHPTYLVVDITSATGAQRNYPARVHLYQTGPAAWRVVGLERPDGHAPLTVP